MKIKEIVNNPETKAGKVFDLFFQGMIVLSLILHPLETVPEFSKEYQKLFSRAELFIIISFSIEYILRLYYSPIRIKFLFSFFGIIDLLTILPFFLFGSANLKFLRVFRLLRILKLLRYSDALTRFKKAFLSIKNELIVFWSVTVMSLYVSAAGIYHFESEAQPQVFKSMFHSMWWAVTTLTTVGYGDTYPITLEGKIFTFFVLMIGLGIVAIPPALMASALMKKDS